MHREKVLIAECPALGHMNQRLVETGTKHGVFELAHDLRVLLTVQIAQVTRLPKVLKGIEHAACAPSSG